ncbi:MAG: SigB/SigF/SigG family RNA polymerase sigma factor [Coriobacteriia bacterium]|nr:SigB/SigF/SigG family RNA polymerase sigma factor [Coriobacteriia bacterium]
MKESKLIDSSSEDLDYSDDTYEDYKESDSEDDFEEENELEKDVKPKSAQERREARKLARRESKDKKLVWDKERTRELFRQLKYAGDEEARDALVTSHLNLVRFLAHKFKNRGEPVEDLIQVGTVGLIKAIDRFEPERGLEFTTYATPTILGEIKRHFRDKGWSVRVPRRLQELSAKVNKATDALTQKLQRSPNLEEIAEYLEVSVDEVLEAMESGEAYSSVPLETDNSLNDDAPSVIDKYGEEDKRLTGSDDRIVLNEVLSEFTPREQEVIKLRFIDGLTQIEIAHRMEISQVQVSRLLRRTLQRMHDKIDPLGNLSE